MRLISLATALFLATVTPSFGDTVGDFDIAGVRLGAPAQDATDQLLAAGWVVIDPDTRIIKVNRQKVFEYPTNTEFNKDNEKLFLTFTPPTSPDVQDGRVAKINYRVDSGADATDAWLESMMQKVLAKYGTQSEPAGYPQDLCGRFSGIYWNGTEQSARWNQPRFVLGLDFSCTGTGQMKLKLSDDNFDLQGMASALEHLVTERNSQPSNDTSF